MIEIPKQGHRLHFSVSRGANRLRLVLMCTARQPLPSEIARLYGRGVAEGFDVGVIRLENTLFDLGTVLSYDRPMLLILCHTRDVTLDLRLAAKRQFVAHGRPCHWLCAIRIGDGVERSWQAVESHISRLSMRSMSQQGAMASRAHR